MDEAIRNLLDALEAAEAAGAPLTDSVIRDSLDAVIYDGFIRQVQDYRVPADLLLNYTKAAERQNAVVVEAFDKFLRQARQAAAALGLDTPEKRLQAFVHSEATSSSGAIDVGAYFDAIE